MPLQHLLAICGHGTSILFLSYQVHQNMKVVESETTWSPDKGQGLVVIESELADFGAAIEELTGIRAKHLALEYAAKQGCANPHLNGLTMSAYPINRHGAVLDLQPVGPDGAALPLNHPDRQPQAYRVDVPVCRGAR